MSTLEKARRKKELFEKSNKELKDLIQKIREFLTEEGADPESIEKVALQVLSISLPVNRTGLDSVVQKIQQSISNLTDVEKVFNTTSRQLQQARDLLLRAQDARARAEGVKDLTSATRQALNQSDQAIQTAGEALRNALNNLNNTRTATAMVEQQLRDLEDGQMDAMTRLAGLSLGVESLRSKTQLNRGLAGDAKAWARNATRTATGLEQNLNETEKQFLELQMKVDSLGGASGGAGNVHQRANKIKEEAENLLNKANKGIETLKKLERKFRNNEQRMQEQREELEQLERNATDVREEIREQVHKYSNC